jgi:MFS family permease
MFFQQFSGVNAIIFYTTTIFQSAGSQAISPNDATILVGIVQVVATFAACLLTDRAGRRLLLVISGIGCGLSLVLMSVFYFVSSSSDTFKSTYGWIPIVSLIGFIIAFSLGMGPIPWLLMGELLPAHVKSIASGLSSSFNWMCAFLITFFFSYLINGLHDSGTYLLFAIISFVSSVFVIFLLPETRGKSLQEIENLFRGESMS